MNTISRNTPSFRRFCGTALFLTLASAASAQVVLDFETYPDGGGGFLNFARGDVLTTQYAPYGVSFSGQKYKGNGSLVSTELWLFDTNNPTLGGSGSNDGDPDLLTPGFHPSNTKDLGLVLVAQENTNSGKIPDDAQRGGIITVDFAQPVFLHEMELLDLEMANKSSVKGYDSDDNLVFNVNTFSVLADNSYNQLLFNYGSISKLVFDHKDSAALASLKFVIDSSITPVPEPSTIGVLAILSLGGLLFLRRRFRGRGRPAA